MLQMHVSQLRAVLTPPLCGASAGSSHLGVVGLRSLAAFAFGVTPLQPRLTAADDPACVSYRRFTGHLFCLRCKAGMDFSCLSVDI